MGSFGWPWVVTSVDFNSIMRFPNSTEIGDRKTAPIFRVLGPYIWDPKGNISITAIALSVDLPGPPKDLTKNLWREKLYLAPQLPFFMSLYTWGPSLVPDK